MVFMVFIVFMAFIAFMAAMPGTRALLSGCLPFAKMGRVNKRLG